MEVEPVHPLIHFQRLSECLRDILANRDLSEFNQAVYKCANCTTQFCIDKYNQRALEKCEDSTGSTPCFSFFLP